MNILLCNDDGIYAPGIRVLYEALKDLATLHVIAPETEMSAVGHAITISSPLKLRDVQRGGKFFGYGISGTPADCVKLAMSHLLDEPPDLVISGINQGPNAGISILYSGTVSGATEGAILGIPSIALSINTFESPLWETAAAVARQVVQLASSHAFPRGSVLNVNIPNLPVDEVKGMRVVPMAPSRYVEQFDKRMDPRGNTYYWVTGHLELSQNAPQATDVSCLRDGYVTLTPISFDLTNHGELSQFETWSM